MLFILTYTYPYENTDKSGIFNSIVNRGEKIYLEMSNVRSVVLSPISSGAADARMFRYPKSDSERRIHILTLQRKEFEYKHLRSQDTDRKAYNFLLG